MTKLPLTWKTPNHDDPSTTNMSVFSYFSDNDASPMHGNPQTPNLSIMSVSTSDTVTRVLNPNAKPFISMENLNSRTATVDNVTCTHVEISSDKVLPHIILQNLRLKNVDKIIIAHININSIRNKIHLLADMIRGRVDILLISETKLDSTFPRPQFFLQGYSEPHRLDRCEELRYLYKLELRQKSNISVLEQTAILEH